MRSKRLAAALARKARIDLSKVHFCKSSKAKYRLHITVGVFVSAGLAVYGTATGHEGFTHFATVANVVTAILWIWE